MIYNAYGTTIDWARSEAEIKWTFLLELPPSHRQARAPKGFLLPSRYIIPVAQSVFEGFSVVALEIYNSLPL